MTNSDRARRRQALYLLRHALTNLRCGRENARPKSANERTGAAPPTLRALQRRDMTSPTWHIRNDPLPPGDNRLRARTSEVPRPRIKWLRCRAAGCRASCVGRGLARAIGEIPAVRASEAPTHDRRLEFAKTLRDVGSSEQFQSRVGAVAPILVLSLRHAIAQRPAPAGCATIVRHRCFCPERDGTAQAPRGRPVHNRAAAQIGQ